MSDRIVHILPEQVASQIAAGEVVERPASALKELVENALDAGARAVTVEIERGGGALLMVTDDGCGMGREDAILALRRHATSKIRDAADLTAIHTLGFRGEALAAIASVSRMVLRTRRPVDDDGIEIVAVGGEIERVTQCAMAPGTRIEVRDLFFNTPARLKFLKTVATEQGAAADAIQRLALAHYRVAFRLGADGRSVAAMPRAASLLERLRQLFGAKLADRMIAFDYRAGRARAWGLAAGSQESFATPRMVFSFVNGRAVRDRMLARAVAQAYATLIPRGRHPAVALMIELRAEEVDVNVHPMKTEVRFRNSGAVFELVYHALRARLSDQTGVNDGGNGGTPADNEGENQAATADGGGGLIDIGATDIDETAPAAASSGAGLREALGADRPLRLIADAPAALRGDQRPLGLGYRHADQAAAGPDGTAGLDDGSAGPGPAAISQIAAALGVTDRTGGIAVREAQIPRYSGLRVLGQLFTGYIVLEDISARSDDGLILVDQHAAHERVTFERLKAEMRAGGVRTQALLAPATLELGVARASMVMAGIAELRAIGFELEQFGPSTLLLKAAPAVFGAAGDGLKLLRDMIEGIGEGGGRARDESAFEDLLKRLACHGSVRVGRQLAAPEITALLTALDATPFKSNCPHGRPVHIRFARGSIERLFRR
ncbi:MAG TPA: DNA mismatch repair endonuclease MutL [Candidatus Binataceae bacterium]|jgi:DNA mismatch repair protein MutL